MKGGIQAGEMKGVVRRNRTDERPAEDTDEGDDAC